MHCIYAAENSLALDPCHPLFGGQQVSGAGLRWGNAEGDESSGRWEETERGQGTKQGEEEMNIFATQALTFSTSKNHLKDVAPKILSSYRRGEARVKLATSFSEGIKGSLI